MYSLFKLLPDFKFDNLILPNLSRLITEFFLNVSLYFISHAKCFKADNFILYNDTNFFLKMEITLL